ncbi:MAG TPA: DUF4360 domain-containing protein [Rugosimonospora sp.]|nr:DUF4360 domain-containing protein [Rugosimonospora sp.]
MGRLAVVALVATLVASTAGAAHARAYAADVVPGPGQVTLDVLSINGSGCPAGSATVTMLPDNTGFRVTYSSFVALSGGGSPATAFRKNCQLGVQVNVPQGFTFAIARADYLGRAALAAGATALERTNYYFQGNPGNNVADHPLAGPLSGVWHTTDVTDVTALVFEPCGVSSVLNINTELRVSAGSSGVLNWIAMSASDGSVDTIVSFQWEQC